MPLVFQRLHQLSGIATIGILCVFPFSGFQNLFGPLSPKVAKHWPLLAFAAAFSSFALYWVSRAFRNLANRGEPSVNRIAPPSLPTLSSTTLGVAGLAVLGILVFTWYGVFQGPLDADEAWKTTFFVQDPYFGLNPLKHVTHALAAFFSMISGAIFGRNEVSLRLPSLLFTGLFLIGLLAFARRNLRAFSLLLILGNFLTNKTLLWYLHSARGYVLMVVCCTLSVLILFRAMHTRVTDYRPSIVVYSLALFFAPMAHAFGALYFIFQTVALAFWCSIYGRGIESERKRFYRQAIWAGLIAAPLMAILLAFNAIDIAAYGYMGRQTFPLNTDFEILRMLGIPFRWAWLPIMVVLIGTSLFRKSNPHGTFLGFLLGFSMVCILCLIKLSGAYMVEGRMYLSLIVPTLLFIGLAIEGVPRPAWRRSFAVIALFSLCVLPMLSGRHFFVLAPRCWLTIHGS